MRRARYGLMLLETVVGVALLALLGVLLLKLQARSMRQLHDAREQAAVVADVEALLWNWSETGAAVTIPATGEFAALLRWERSAEPVRVASGVFATQVSLIVSRDAPPEPPRPIYRVDWLVPETLPGESGR